MIRVDNVSKQNGHQLLFSEASMGGAKGEKVGLVGPNGAGKTTLFRMITGQEDSDDGLVVIDPGMTIGYFSQDVGEMSGRSAAAEVMNGAGPVSEVAAELHALEAAMVDPDRLDEMDEIIARYGDVQARYEELDGYGLESRAREVLAGLSFSQEMMDGDVGKLSGGWKMRVALARILLMRPDVMLLDEPSNHLDLESLIWLETFLKGYDGALLMTSHDREFMNRIVNKIIEIDGAVHHLLAEAQPCQNLARPAFQTVAVQFLVARLHVAVARNDLVHLVQPIGIDHCGLERVQFGCDLADRPRPVHHLGGGATTRHLADILAEIADRHVFLDRDLPLVRQFPAGDHAEERGLAGAVGSDQSDLLAAIERRRGFDKEDAVAAGLADIVDADHEKDGSLLEWASLCHAPAALSRRPPRIGEPSLVRYRSSVARSATR